MHRGIAAAELDSNRSNNRRLLDIVRKQGLLLALLALALLFMVANRRFISASNLINILRQSSINVLLAAGVVFVISHGEIDLSVGSVMALAGVIASGLAVKFSTALGLAVGTFLGVGLGLVNGLIVNYVLLPSFIVTLAMMTIARGFSFIYTQGVAITGLPGPFQYLGNGDLGPFPFIIVSALVAMLLLDVLLRCTRFGRNTRAIGDNREAARLSGIHVRQHSTVVFGLSGLFAAIAGIFLASRIISGHPAVASGYELNAIAAVVIGGGSLKGGVGSVFGAALGALFMTTLSNGLNLLNVSSFWQMVVVGVVILLAIATEKFRG